MWSALTSSFSSSLDEFRLLLELVECLWRWIWTDLGGTFTSEKNNLCLRKSLFPKIEHMIVVGWVDVISDRSKSELLPGGSWYKSEGGLSVVPWRRWGLGLLPGCSICSFLGESFSGRLDNLNTLSLNWQQMRNPLGTGPGRTHQASGQLVTRLPVWFHYLSFLFYLII